MDLYKVNEIYREKRKGLLRSLTLQNTPIAFILGGQPASGKSKLSKEFQVKDNLKHNSLIYNILNIYF